MKAGWVVFDLGALPRAAGPTSEVAIVTADDLELSARALDLEAEAVPRWWRA